jgi:hypothetical protein
MAGRGGRDAGCEADFVVREAMGNAATINDAVASLIVAASRRGNGDAPKPALRRPGVFQTRWGPLQFSAKH